MQYDHTPLILGSIAIFVCIYLRRLCVVLIALIKCSYATPAYKCLFAHFLRHVRVHFRMCFLDLMGLKTQYLRKSSRLFPYQLFPALQARVSAGNRPQPLVEVR